MSCSCPDPLRLAASDCPTHGHDAVLGLPYSDVGQPCGGRACDGRTRYCSDCRAAIDEYLLDLAAAYYGTI